MFGGGAAAAALAAVPVAAVAVAGPASPDAELIRLCGALVRAETAFDSDRSLLEPEENPLWHAILDIEKQLDGMEAQTLAGVIAKADVALFEARQPNGSLNFSTSFVGDWTEQVVCDLLLLRNRGEVRA